MFMQSMLANLPMTIDIGGTCSFDEKRTAWVASAAVEMADTLILALSKNKEE
jgi:hypothetical protein